MLLLQGLRQEDVAKRLSLSAKTINTHKSRLFQKLGIDDGMSLARLARQYGVVDPGRVGCRAGGELAAEAAPATAPSPAEAGQGWGWVARARAMPGDSCTRSDATPSQPPLRYGERRLGERMGRQCST